MDQFDFSTKEGIQKFIITIIGIVATVVTSAFGISPDKASIWVSLLTQFAPLIAVVVYYIVNQYAAKGKAAASQVALETKVAMVKSLAVISPEVAIAVVNANTLPTAEPPITIPDEPLPVPKNWDAFKQQVKDKVDDELRGQLAEGIIVGVSACNVSREEARNKVPIMSSLNSARIWTRSEQFALAIEGTMQEALDYWIKILLPAAEAAVIDQRGQLLPNGKICDWPPNSEADKWLRWCKDNIAGIQKNIAEKVYNLNGYNLWNTGEISSGLFENAGIDPVTGVQKKRIAVDTTYKNGIETKHYYPETNWY